MQVAPFQRSRTRRADRGLARRHVVHQHKLHFLNRHLTDPFILRCVCELQCHRSRWVVASFPPRVAVLACIALTLRCSLREGGSGRGGQRIATPATRTTAPKVSAEAASICSGFPAFIRGLMADHRYTLAGARACRETSEFVAFDPACSPSASQNWGRASSRLARLPGSVGFVSTSGAHKPPSHHTFVQALGTTPTLTFHVEIMRG